MHFASVERFGRNDPAAAFRHRTVSLDPVSATAERSKLTLRDGATATRPEDRAPDCQRVVVCRRSPIDAVEEPLPV